MKENFIYHIIPQLEWEAICEHEYYRPNSLDTEGFIHFSYKEQLCNTAARFYTGRTDLFALKVESELLISALKNDSVPGGDIFPHLYGPLNLNAVVQVHQLKLNSDLTFSLIDGAE